MRLHIDTDFGGNPDDACAIAMLLGWPDVEVTAISTTGDPDGRRAGYLADFLRLLDRPDIPVAAGAGLSLTTGRPMGEIASPARYWGYDTQPQPGEPARAWQLLADSVEVESTIVALGPMTNLAAADTAHPGLLSAARVVAMGGWDRPLADGLPDWGPARDWNIQADTEAATAVAAAADLTLSTIPGSAPAQLRGRDLPRLASSGQVGELLARQSLAWCADRDMLRLARACRGLPSDLVNFHWDPVAAGIAVGWHGAELEQCRLSPVLHQGLLRFVHAPDAGPRTPGTDTEPAGNAHSNAVTAARRTAVLAGLDAAAFSAVWLAAVEAAQAGVGQPRLD